MGTMEKALSARVMTPIISPPVRRLTQQQHRWKQTILGQTMSHSWSILVTWGVRDVSWKTVASRCWVAGGRESAGELLVGEISSRGLCALPRCASDSAQQPGPLCPAFQPRTLTLTSSAERRGRPFQKLRHFASGCQTQGRPHFPSSTRQSLLIQANGRFSNLERQREV